MMRLRSLLALALALAIAGCEKKPGAAESAQHFFEQVAAGQAQAAYQGAAFGFQAQRSAAAFEVAAKEMGLTDYASGQWEQPEIDGSTAKIAVRVQTRAGKEFPLVVTLTRESGTWRVYSLRSPRSEATGISENRFSLVGKTPSFTDAVAQPVPPEAELRQLVRETLLRFNDAIATKSFDAFYDSVSVAWQTGRLTQGQNQLTKGQLQRAFQSFIDQQVNIGGIAKVEPIWEAPVSVGSDGLLVATGHYPTEPYRVYFALKFIYELPNWKLFGIDVNLRK
jgi:hypothetical protein